MKSTYASGTTVSAEKSRAELDVLLGKHGATSRAIVADDDTNKAAVMFILGGRKYRLDVPMPDRASYKRGNPDMRRRAWEQGCRERWRAMVLLVKAKLELVKIGVSSVEAEFLACAVLPDGSTVQETIAERLTQALKGAPNVRLLPEFTGARP